MLFGVFLIVFGGLFLLENLGLLPAGIWGVFWPLALIALGLKLIMRSNGCCCGWWSGSKEKWGKKEQNDDEER